MSEAVGTSSAHPSSSGGGGFPLFRVGGIQVRLDPSWLLIFALIWWSLAAGYFPRVHPEAAAGVRWLAALISALLFFASLLVHELSHSFMAKRAGLDVPSIRLFLFGGVSEMTREPDDPGTEFRIAIVGPLASFALAAAFGLLAAVLPDSAGLAVGVVGYLAWINLALGVFNLLPGLPLDGGRVLRAFVWWRTGSLRRASEVAANAGKGLGLGLAFLGGIQIFSGALLGGVWLILIGLFARGLAEASHQSLVLRQALAGVAVREVMAAEPVTVSPDLPLVELVEEYILGHGFRSFPVIEGRRVLGLVTLDAVKRVPVERRAHERVRDHLEPLDRERCVAPETPLVDALALMGRFEARRLLVLKPGTDELAGLLTGTALTRFIEIQQALAPREAR